MTKEQFEREKNYMVSFVIAKTTLSKGLISDKEYRRIDAMLVEKYRPVMGSF